MRARALALALLVACSCGAPSSARRFRRPARAAGAIELALRRPDGRFIDVGDLRGHVVLLFVFATFDAMSQLALHPLRELAEADRDLRIVGIAAQPSARLLVDAYVHALSPPFPVTYDPEELVPVGESSLGVIDAVPTFIVLDRRGVPAARHVGFASRDRLRELVAAGSR